jgi:hypothetical protein
MDELIKQITANLVKIAESGDESSLWHLEHYLQDTETVLENIENPAPDPPPMGRDAEAFFAAAEEAVADRYDQFLGQEKLDES